MVLLLAGQEDSNTEIVGSNMPHVSFKNGNNACQQLQRDASQSTLLAEFLGWGGGVSR